MVFQSALGGDQGPLADWQRKLLEVASARQNDMLVITEAAPIDAPDGPRIVFVNDAFERVTGYTRAEAIGATPRILQGRRTQRAELDRVRTALEVGQQVRVEIINYTKAGAEYWVEIDITPVHDDEMRPVYFVALQREITDRKTAQEDRRISEERFKILSEATSDFIWDWDLEQDRVWWNEGLKANFGYDPEAISSGAEFWERIVHPDDRQRVCREFREVLAGNSSRCRIDYRILRADGTSAYVRNEASVIRDSYARPLRLVGSTKDISDVRVHAENAAQSQKLAALGQLTGGIAHDFNNLLTVILGNAEVLAEAPEIDSERRALSEMIVQAGQRASELTGRLLSFARRQTLQPKVLDLNEAILGMIPLIRRSITENVDLRTELADDLWTALVDHGQLEVAILNLALNARDSLDAGGLIAIETRNAELDGAYARDHADVVEGEYVMVCVSDNGAGMAPEIANHAFEPFFTTKQHGKGSGLGLSMVYGFVKQSGGHIKIYSEIGSGTSVKLYFPRVVGELVHPAREIPGASVGGSERVLVVEDDPLVLNFVSAQLRSLGYEVAEAMSVAEATEWLESPEAFDLLFTDVILPGSDSGSVVEMAKAIRPEIKILLTSGYAESSMVHRGWLRRDLKLLSKPYSRRQLAKTIREVLEQP